MNHKINRELSRLNGVDLNVRPILTKTLRIKCQKYFTDEILQRTKSIIRIINDNSKCDIWPPISQWEIILPNWFLNACGSALTAEEAERQLAQWKRSSHLERELMERNVKWALDDWLYWMVPEMRGWIWWDDKIDVHNEFIYVTLEVDSWPIALGSATWLFKAAGALFVEII